ncbi:MAG: acyltransferase family protein, partial [Muribaculaceae bacterium]|nr:acyltransferase family protein [Muribaculaceae bacterium]
MASVPRVIFRNNFGAIRYILAFAIFLSHFNVLTGAELRFPISGYYRVCSFFVISGFLIYGSYHRASGWKDYLSNRAWRILPSYLIAVVGAAVLLVYVSDLPAVEYFTDSRWIRYLLLNAATLNFMQPSLPGVFENHDITAVNGALWTMKVEWALYLFIIPVIILSKKYGVSMLKVFVGIFIFSVIYKWTMLHMGELTGSSARLFHLKYLDYISPKIYF